MLLDRSRVTSLVQVSKAEEIRERGGGGMVGKEWVVEERQVMGGEGWGGEGWKGDEHSKTDKTQCNNADPPMREESSLTEL